MPDFSGDEILARDLQRERQRLFRQRVTLLVNLIVLVALAGFCVGTWTQAGQCSAKLAELYPDSAMMPLQRVSLFVSHGFLFARQRAEQFFTGKPAEKTESIAQTPRRTYIEPTPRTPAPIAKPVARPKPTPTEVPEAPAPPAAPSEPQSPPEPAVQNTEPPPQTEEQEPQGTPVLPSQYPIPRPPVEEVPEAVPEAADIAVPTQLRVPADVQALLDKADAEFAIANNYYRSAQPEAPAAGRPAATLACANHLRLVQQYYQAALKLKMPIDTRDLVQKQLTQAQRMLYWMNKFSPVRQ